MITTSSELTLSMATAFGLYMIAGGVSGIVARDRWIAMIDDFNGHAALIFIGSAFVYVVGVVIILTHSIWTDLLAGFISLVGWVAAVEGLLGIAFPKALLGLASTMARPQFIKIFAFSTIALGALLTVLGLSGTVA